MEIVLEILKITIPALVVFIAVYFVLKKVLENETEKRMLELKSEKANDFTPLRLQAYERLILLLERISPNNMVLRVHKKGMSARFFQLELIKTIRAEYEHNLTQQLYVSSSSWRIVTGAKEEMLKLVSLAASGLEKDATAEDLSAVLIKNTAEVQNLPTKVAIEFLKKEVRKMF